MTQVRITDETAKKLKALSWSESLRTGGRVTQGDIIQRAIAALETEIKVEEQLRAAQPVDDTAT